MENIKIEFELPSWLMDLQDLPEMSDDADRMAFAIRLARRNIEMRTGGPFGAAIFESVTGRLVAPGINLVESSNCSMLHAEVVAIMLAQRRIGTYDLGCAGMRKFELVSSVEPCAMCLGAVQWSGISRLICGARGEDAESIGFDEGYKGEGWVDALLLRGIEVVRDIGRKDAIDVLNTYKEMGGTIYNGKRNPLVILPPT